MNRIDKFWIALTSIGLGSLILGALGIAALILASGCAAKPVATVPDPPEEILRVLVLASVPGDAWFCMEDPQVNGFFREPNVRTGRVVCALTVNQLRRAIAQLQEAE